MARRNPFTGTHPDLFPLAHQYPLGTPTHKLPDRPGETPVFVPIGDLSSEQIRELPRKAFSNEEWDELDEDDQEAIVESDEESQDRVDDLARVFISAFEWAGDTGHLDFSHVEDSFEYALRDRARRLWSDMPVEDHRELMEKGAAMGIGATRVDELINEQMQDTNNYDFNPRNPHGRDPFWSEPIHGDVYIEKGEWEDEYEVMFPDEVVRAINKIDKYTYGEIDLDYDFFEERSKKKHAEFSHSWDTGEFFHVYANWDRIIGGVEDAMAEEEVDDAFDLPGSPPPEERVVYRWPDGFYVQDLLPSELAAEGKAMGMCVGRADMGYGQAVRDNEIKILSLRRPSGKPLFTFEASIAKGGDDQFRITEFDQIKGKANRLPGFDLGKEGYLTQREVVGERKWSENKFAIMAAARSIKREEVQRAIEYIKSTPAPITATDLMPALTAIALLSLDGDKWASDIVNKSKALQLGIEDDRHVLEGIVSSSATQLSSKAPEPKQNPDRKCGIHDSQCTGFCRPYQRNVRRNPSGTLVGYHGSYTSSRKPVQSQLGDFGPGIYFASDLEDAQEYGPHVYRAELATRRPLVVVDELTPEMDSIRRALRITDEDLEVGDGAPWMTIAGLANALIDAGLVTLRRFTDVIKKAGYDSIVVPARVVREHGAYPESRGGYVIVFDESQILDWRSV